MRRSILWVCLLALAAMAPAAPFEHVAGDLRVQILSPGLVRLEQRGPQGFEDRPTFTVVRRDWPGASVVVRRIGEATALISPRFRVLVRNGGLRAAEVQDALGRRLYAWDGKLDGDVWLPSPAELRAKRVWSFCDHPRLAKTRDRLFPVVPGQPQFDTGNDAPDVYVFVPGPEGYAGLRREFLRLTGPVPMPPLYLFGFIDSRYHAYTERSALETIDLYRRKGLPLDVFVVDTDWRIGASHGYAPNTELFPDMARFIREAHKRRVRLMYNDHPEPVDPDAQSDKELQYRFDGLASLLRQGMDVWWYDRNWGTHLGTPARGLPLEVWGMHLYAEATRAVRPQRRPAIMANVWGIDNGWSRGSTHPAAHRYPIWWTGDTLAQWRFLRMGVENGVNFGVHGLQPYVHEDLGGHAGQPSPELYVRFLQFGCFSPITRVHCTKGQERYPWSFGPEAEAIVRRYALLRYRLLPTIYAAAYRSYVDGTPLLRRGDLEWPDRPELADPTQYLFGDDLLVAPILEGAEEGKPVPASLFRTPDSQPGLRGEYFDNPNLRGAPKAVRTDAAVDFDFGLRAPTEGLPKDNYSIRWTGKIGPFPQTGTYRFHLLSDDGVRLWIGGKPVIDRWVPQASVWNRGEVKVKAGQVLEFRLEFYNGVNEGVCRLHWSFSERRLETTRRTVFLPPGEWQNLWTGAIESGPKKIEVEAPLDVLPLWVRRSGLVLSTPQVLNTQDVRWDRIVVDAFVGRNAVRRELYEDDGISVGYESGQFGLTPLRMTPSPKEVALEIGPATGTYAGMPSERVWTLRLHLPPRTRATDVSWNGRPLPFRTLHTDGRRPEILLLGAGSKPAPSEPPVIEAQVRLPSRSRGVLRVRLASSADPGRIVRVGSNKAEREVNQRPVASRVDR
ncbi:MAG: TIM-barrel domain-containing protein [Fimbriimonadales bacterium]